MERLAKILVITYFTALALTAVSAAGASASTFTASATGTLKGHTTTVQVFTVGGSNKVTCKFANTEGTIESVASEEQKATVEYSTCTASFFGFPAGEAFVSKASYNFTANGQVHILNEIHIKDPSLGCETILQPQTKGTITYENRAEKIETHANVTGIESFSPNGCPSGSAGTYTGSNLIERAFGGSISWDA